MDCELVITAVQLNVPLPPVGQPARCDPLKCAYVSYADSPSPMRASASVVHCSQAGGPAGLAGAAGSAATAACRFARLAWVVSGACRLCLCCRGRR